MSIYAILAALACYYVAGLVFCALDLRRFFRLLDAKYPGSERSSWDAMAVFMTFLGALAWPLIGVRTQNTGV